MKLANALCNNAPGFFQVWYIKALFIKLQDLILSIEVTTYTSAGQPVRHVAGSGEVYMGFGTAMEISVVTVSAYGSSGSNTQIMMHVVSLEEELLDVSEYQGVPIDECYGDSPLGLCGVTAEARWPWPSSRPDRTLRRPHDQIQGNQYRQVPHAETDDLEVVAEISSFYSSNVSPCRSLILGFALDVMCGPRDSPQGSGLRMILPWFGRRVSRRLSRGPRRPVNAAVDGSCTFLSACTWLLRMSIDAAEVVWGGP